MLERLAKSEFYWFLDGFSGYFQISIDPKDQEKTTFTCPYGTLAYRRMPFGLCNAPGTFQRCTMVIFHDMIEETMEEKCHFMVKYGIVLGHKISKSGIEVDKDKVDVIARLPHPTTVRGIRSFLGHVGFYRRFIQYFSKISRSMTRLLEKETPFFFFKECIESFNTLKKKLTEASILIAPDWDLPFEIMCDASDFAVEAVVGQPLKYLLAKQDAKPRLLRWILLLQEFDVIIRDGVFSAKKLLISLRLAIMDPSGDIMVPITPLKRSLISNFIGPLITVMPITWTPDVTLVNVKAKSSNMMKCLKMQFKFVRSLTYGASILWARSCILEGTSAFSWLLTTCQNGLKRKRSPLMMPEL
nr:reverse transcriptase domain-containing protein [Tanacetum cinerariifolium]